MYLYAIEACAPDSIHCSLSEVVDISSHICLRELGDDVPVVDVIRHSDDVDEPWVCDAAGGLIRREASVEMYPP